MIKFAAGHSSVWKEIQLLSKPKRPIQAAIAWVTDNSILRLGKGDRLVVNAGDNAIKSTATDRSLIRSLVLDRGVSVWSNDLLHAKVIIIGDVLVVGSMNASSASQDRLIEALVLTDRVSAISDSIRWLDELRKVSQKVDDLFIKRMMKLPIKPKSNTHKPPANASIPETHAKHAFPSAWMFCARTDRARNAPYIKQGSQTIQRAYKNDSSLVYGFYLYNPATNGRWPLQEGDLVFEQYFKNLTDSTPLRVYEAGVIWRLEHVGDMINVHVHWSPSLEKRALSWSKFKQLAKSAGIEGPMAGYEWKLRKNQARKLMSMWPEA